MNTKGNQARKIRRRLGLTQREVSDRLETPFRTIQDIEARAEARPIHVAAYRWMEHLAKKGQ